MRCERESASYFSHWYSVTAAIFAGTVPYLLTLLIAKTGIQMMPAFYLIAVGVLGLVTVLTIRETKGSNLLSEDLALAAAKSAG